MTETGTFSEMHTALKQIQSKVRYQVQHHDNLRTSIDQEATHGDWETPVVISSILKIPLQGDICYPRDGLEIEGVAQGGIDVNVMVKKEGDTEWTTLNTQADAAHDGFKVTHAVTGNGTYAIKAASTYENVTKESRTLRVNVNDGILWSPQKSSWTMTRYGNTYSYPSLLSKINFPPVFSY